MRFLFTFSVCSSSPEAIVPECTNWTSNLPTSRSSPGSRTPIGGASTTEDPARYVLGSPFVDMTMTFVSLMSPDETTGAVVRFVVLRYIHSAGVYLPSVFMFSACHSSPCSKSASKSFTKGT